MSLLSWTEIAFSAQLRVQYIHGYFYDMLNIFIIQKPTPLSHYRSVYAVVLFWKIIYQGPAFFWIPDENIFPWLQALKKNAVLKQTSWGHVGMNLIVTIFYCANFYWENSFGMIWLLLSQQSLPQSISYSCTQMVIMHMEIIYLCFQYQYHQSIICSFSLTLDC